MNCRICHAETFKMLDLGTLPLANSLEPPEAKKYPLVVYRCSFCNLIQLEDLVPTSEIFSSYLYQTGASEPMRHHFAEYAEQTVKDFGLSSSDSVLDIGSNDGTLLEEFRSHGLSVTGVEPAKNLADTAKVPTVCGFFDEEMAKDLGMFSVVTANNVLSHVPDLHGFIRAVSLALPEKGVFLFETPWIVNVLRKNAFDFFYQEHLTYFGFKSLSRVLAKYDLGLVNLIPFPDIHGGSFRGVAVKDSLARYSPIFDEENNMPMLAEEFASNVPKVAAKLRQMLKSLKSEGWKVAGYGAPAKATVLLNYCHIGTDLIDWVQDTTVLKQGKTIPATGLRIVSPEYGKEHPPDYYLMLAWNYEKEILAKEKDYHGRFLVPFPEPHFA